MMVPAEGKMIIEQNGSLTSVAHCLYNDERVCIVEVEQWNTRNNYLHEVFVYDNVNDVCIDAQVLEVRQMHGMKDGY